MPAKIKIPNLNDIVSRYQAGESALKLSREFNIERNVIRRRLVAMGIALRTNSQACLIRMSRMTPADRRAITANANKAAKGRHPARAERLKGAKTRESRRTGASAIEFIMADMLMSRGVKNLVHQKAIGVYNVDIAIKSPRIAIEIMGGNWHTSEHHALLHHKRIPYILNAGWTVVIIWVNAKSYPLTIKAGDYIITLMERLRLNKSSRGEYHVIRGNGDMVPITSSNFNCLPSVKSTAPR